MHKEAHVCVRRRITDVSLLFIEGKMCIQFNSVASASVLICTLNNIVCKLEDSTEKGISVKCTSLHVNLMTVSAHIKMFYIIDWIIGILLKIEYFSLIWGVGWLFHYFHKHVCKYVCCYRVEHLWIFKHTFNFTN